MSNPRENPWTVLESKIVYQTEWLRVREDRVRDRDGVETTYSVVELPHSVAIVVFNDKDEVALVGQWRYPHQRFSWEIPTGGCSGAEELPLAAAQRELQEETGVTATDWQELGTIDNSNGSTTDTAHLFVARATARVGSDPDPTEKLSVRWVAFDRAIEMVQAGDITESGSVVALLKVAGIKQQPPHARTTPLFRSRGPGD